MAPVDLLEKLGRPPAVAALDGEESVYVVGGAVRDLLLGRRPHELDFVVEGDAVAVARRIGGRVIAHERFGTATVSVDGVTFDLASARRERYPRPGALPEVELGATMREDLERRDFTVNAIALHLADGELTWLPGAEADLRAGRLRVLHDESFRDDPTRLLRLARYAARLGFEPEQRTDRLAAEAVAAGAVETITGSRMGAELRLLLREPQPAALLALERHGLGEALLDRFSVDPGLVERTLALCPPDGRTDLVALAACLSGDRASIAARLDALAFPADERAIVAPAASRASYVADAIDPARFAAEAGDPGAQARDADAESGDADVRPGEAESGDADVRPGDAELWRSLRRERPETVALAGALGPAEAARRWLEDVRHRRLAITGDDIVAAGLTGPAVGAALDAAMVAMLEGRAEGREEQLAAALG
jgi:tRNA nucleotidyltransferase (CCA-adding enzyme)